MKIEKNKVASLAYTLKNDDDEIVDQADSSAPLLYIHGTEGIIPGLENALDGRQVNDKFDVSIPPEDAYGEYNEKLTQVVPREMFEGMGDVELEVGMQFQADTSGGPQIVTITNIDGDEIVIDGNHPLANMTLHFAIEVLDIRDATEEEIAHGHVHTDGTCDSDNA